MDKEREKRTQTCEQTDGVFWHCHIDGLCCRGAMYCVSIFWSFISINCYYLYISMQNECYTCLFNGHLLLIEFNNMKRLIIMISITVAKVTEFHLVFYYKCCNSDWILHENIIMLNLSLCCESSCDSQSKWRARNWHHIGFLLTCAWASEHIHFFLLSIYRHNKFKIKDILKKIFNIYKDYNRSTDRQYSSHPIHLDWFGAKHKYTLHKDIRYSSFSTLKIKWQKHWSEFITE